MNEIEKDVTIENLSYKVICMLADFKKIKDTIETPSESLSDGECIDIIKEIINKYNE